jgi:hypothetical protein
MYSHIDWPLAERGQFPEKSLPIVCVSVVWLVVSEITPDVRHRAFCLAVIYGNMYRLRCILRCDESWQAKKKYGTEQQPLKEPPSTKPGYQTDFREVSCVSHLAHPSQNCVLPLLRGKLRREADCFRRWSPRIVAFTRRIEQSFSHSRSKLF